MQVFNPAQAKSAAEARTAKDALRATTIADITKQLLEENSKADLEFKEGMERRKKEAEEWYERQAEQRNELLKEVERLEERRRLALIPPLIKAEDIHSVEEGLWARKLELDAQEAENESASRALMQRLDEVSTRELAADRLEKRLKVQERGAEAQREQVAQDAKRLSRELADFEKRMNERETDLAYQQSELDAQKNLQDEKERLLLERENEVVAANRLLSDQRVLLSKGFDELRRLKEKHGSTERSLSS